MSPPPTQLGEVTITREWLKHIFMPGQTISITVNGQSLEIATGSTIADCLASQGVRTQLVAVERNLEIVPQQEHASTLLSEGDQIEVVTLVGGG